MQLYHDLNAFVYAFSTNSPGAGIFFFLFAKEAFIPKKVILIYARNI
jgi:hypothetical protein